MLGELHAHNASFERLIWQHVCVARLGWPEVQLEQWRCTAAKAAASGLPRSLDGAAKALKLDVEKDKDGHRVMMQLSKPRKPSKNNPSTRWTEPEKYERLYSYCKRDVEVEMAVDRALKDLHRTEWRVYQLDQRINDRGIPLDRDLAEAAIAVDKKLQARGDERLRVLTGGKATSTGQVARILRWCIDQGVNLPNLDKEAVEEALRGELPDAVREVLLLRQQFSQSSIKKYQAMIDRIEADDRVRGTLMYYGAQTGRWAGRGVQFQNLPRGNMKPADIETAVEAIKTRDVEVMEMLF